MATGRAKIFGIGLSKTGTSSLAQALQRLGFRTKDCMGTACYVAGDLSSIDMQTVLDHDALTDTPIPSFYRELDARFPGSKFILTVRDREGWLQSCRKQFNERAAATQSEAHRRLFEDLYGTNAFDEHRFAAGYDRFVAGVHEYFRDRPQDLLVMNVTAGDGWEKLCPFLGSAVPNAPFPKVNVTSIRWIKIDRLVAVAEATGRELLKTYQGDVADPLAPRRGGHARGAVSVFNRVLDAALGRDAVDSAIQRAHRALVAGLSDLQTGIRVLSPVEEPAPYEERRTWSHVWLVDPVDGRQSFVDGRPDFSVNIALIENGRPIYGVVHAPALRITYFGKIGKGAYRRDAAGALLRLPSSGAGSAACRASDTRSSGGSISLALCVPLEEATRATPAFERAREWRFAAGHAVLKATEEFMVTDIAGSEPQYNTRDLAVGTVQVRAWKAACAA